MKTINKVLLGMGIAGMVLVVLGFSMGARREIQTMYENKELGFGMRNTKYTEINQTFLGINALAINVDAYAVIIREHTEENVRVEGSVRDNIVVTQDGDTVFIKDKGRFFTFGFWWWEEDTVTVYVPENMILQMVSIDVDAGSVTIDGTLHSRILDMRVDAGKIKADTMICEEGSFNVNAGSIDITQLDSYDSVFDVDAGKIKVSVIGEEEEYSYTAKCDVGSITIGNFRSKGISTKDSGGNGKRYIDAKCDAGNIEIRMKGG